MLKKKDWTDLVDNMLQMISIKHKPITPIQIRLFIERMGQNRKI